jgi:hypothetical protein
MQWREPRSSGPARSVKSASRAAGLRSLTFYVRPFDRSHIPSNEWGANNRSTNVHLVKRTLAPLAAAESE